MGGLDSMDLEILVDGHVHLHPSFELSSVLDSVASNLGRHARTDSWIGVICALELRGSDAFGDLHARVGRGEVSIGSWRLDAVEADSAALRARRGTDGRAVFIVAGSQVATRERLEVCLVGSRARVADGLPFDETLAAARKAAPLIVVPWGVGKWAGARGGLVSSALRGWAGEPPALASDNGGRPVFWPRPSLFAELEAQGQVVLAGSDPLAWRAEASRIGSFGVTRQAPFDPEAPTTSLIRALRGGAGWRRFGSLLSPWRFLRTQVGLRWPVGVRGSAA
jgi:hypothetical protein